MRELELMVYWAKGSILGLFKYGREVGPAKWFIPLMITSDATAEFKVAP